MGSYSGPSCRHGPALRPSATLPTMPPLAAIKARLAARIVRARVVTARLATCAPVTAIKRARKTTPARGAVFTAPIAVRPTRPVRPVDPFAIPALAAATEIRFPVAECPARASARNALRARICAAPTTTHQRPILASLHSAWRRADRPLYRRTTCV